jgi:hypothetical protein
MTKKPFSTVYFVYDTNEELIEDSRTDEPYSGFVETNQNATFRCVRLKEPTDTWNFERVKVDFEPKANQTVWVTYANYVDGSTFGRENGKICAVVVSESRDVARYEANQAENNEKHALYGRLHDYFGGLEAMHVVEATIED